MIKKVKSLVKTNGKGREFKTVITAIFSLLILSKTMNAQTKRVPTSHGRAEYVEEEKNVNLHITDLGEGKTWF